MVTRVQIIEEARTWLDVPWRHQGRNRAGIDCVGLIVKVTQALGLNDYDRTDYSRKPNGFDFVKVFRDRMDIKSVGNARPGDLVLIANGPYPCHVGLIAEKYGALSIIHATVQHRKVAEETYAHELVTRTTHCFQFRNIED